MPLLSLQNITTHYGKIRALKGISLEIEPGEIVCLIGANGAGKTTTLKTICGLLKPTQGKLFHKDEDITRLPAHKIVARGIALVPEGRQVFAKMTTQENLEMGAYTCRDPKQVKEQIENMYTLFPRLKERQRQLAGTLSGGSNKCWPSPAPWWPGRVCCCWMSLPWAWHPRCSKVSFKSILDVNQKGTTVLLVEQNTQIALDVASRGYVMQTGEISLAGTTKSLKSNEMVKKTYLGMS